MRLDSLYQAAIQILDQYLGQKKLENCLKSWGRNNRFAGSSDRRLIRDIVYDVVRQKNSCAYIGGGETGRQLIVGYLILSDKELNKIFTGLKFAPKNLSDSEMKLIIRDYRKLKVYELDYPDWLLPIIKKSLRNKFNDFLTLSRNRALVQLRVNNLKTSRKNVLLSLKNDEIECEQNNLVSTAINVLNNSHKIMQSDLFKKGFVEFQDAGSQLVSGLISVNDGDRVLDLCAGSGGKTLAVACKNKKSAEYFAWDKDFNRMKDLHSRANRAGIEIKKLSNKPTGICYDLIIIDAPCSGSGSWRRDPLGKWSLNLEKLSNYISTQKELIFDGLNMLKKNGKILYITCSVLSAENEQLLDEVMATKVSCRVIKKFSLFPSRENDGFFGAVIQKI